LEGASVNLVELESKYREEIDRLSKLVEQNPQLAQAHAKVKELEGRIR